MSARLWRIALLAARFGLGALFIAAGALKLRDPAAFANDIANYRLFPELASFLALLLPPTEIAAGAALIAAPAAWRRAAALVIGFLMLVFLLGAVSAVVRGLDVSCACFGQSSGSVGWTTVVRDLVLLAAAALVVARDRPAPAPIHAPAAT